MLYRLMFVAGGAFLSFSGFSNELLRFVQSNAVIVVLLLDVCFSY